MKRRSPTKEVGRTEKVPRDKARAVSGIEKSSSIQAGINRRRLLIAGAFAIAGAAALVINTTDDLAPEKSMSSVTSPHSPRTNPEPTDSMLTDSDTPEMDSQIELPEFSIQEVDYKPSVPEGLDMVTSHFEKISKSFFDFMEKDFPQFEQAFDATSDSQEKGQLVSDHIVKYYDYLLSLDPKISTDASSKSMGTFNERCSYMTLFLIGQGRYIGVVNPDPNRRYPKLLYGESKIERKMDVQYEGHHVEFPIVEIDSHVGDVNRAWYDSNNKLMMYSAAETMMEARAMVGAELNSEQLAEFADAMTVSVLRHEGTHALTRKMFPRGTAEQSLRSGHRVTLETMRMPSTQRDWRRTTVQGIEASELTAVGVEVANFPRHLKLYLSKMVPQVVFQSQYQQAYLHLLTYFVNRRTIPLPLRRKIQTFLAKFPRGNPLIVHEVMMDPSLPEAELAEIGKQLFAAGIKIFEQMEQE